MTRPHGPAALGLLTVLLLAGQAQAYVYPVEIHVASEREIWELFYNEDIDDLDRDRLLDLWDRGVMVNTADRNEFYELPGVSRAQAGRLVKARKDQGGFKSVADLAGVLPGHVFDQAEPFLRFDESDELLAKLDLGGAVRVVGVAAQASRRFAESKAGGTIEEVDGDDQLRSSAFLRVRGKAGKRWQTAAVVATHDTVKDYARDPSRSGQPIVSPGIERTHELTHAYLAGAGDDWGFVLGSYTLGFGLGLVYDDSGSARPVGFYPTDRVADADSGGLAIEDRQFGAAALRRFKDLGPGWLTANVFASRAARNLYQYDLSPSDALLTVAEDPEEDSLSFVTFRDAYIEALVGANVAYSLSKDRLFGVTAWTAEAEFNDDLPTTEFAQASNYPPSGRYSAAGGHLRWDFGQTEVLAEAGLTTARCDERRPDWGALPGAACGGAADLTGLGAATVVETAVTDTVDVQVDGWYYGADFANPHATSVSASADEYLGNRNRNQAGARLRSEYRPTSGLWVRGDVAAWRHLEAKPSNLFLEGEVADLPAGVSTPDCAAFSKSGDVRQVDRNCLPRTDARAGLRAEAKVTDREWLLGGIEWGDEDLDHGGRIEDFSGGGGSRVRVRGRVRTKRLDRTVLHVEAVREWEDRTMRTCLVPGADPLTCDTANLAPLLEWDTNVWLAASARLDLTPGPSLVLQARWRDEGGVDSFDGRGNFKTADQREETSLTTSVTLAQKIGKNVAVGLRYRLVNLLDDRPGAPGATQATQDRRNNEHFLRAALDVKF